MWRLLSFRLFSMVRPQCVVNANMAANCRRGHWYCANLTTVKKAMTKERLINGGFYDLTTAYQSVHINYWNRRVPNGTHGGVRGRELITPSYSIYLINTNFSCILNFFFTIYVNNIYIMANFIITNSENLFIECCCI